LMSTDMWSFPRSSLLEGGTVPFQKTSADIVSSLGKQTTGTP
jgi:hypothetical protein